MRRVVVTGMGLVSPLASGVQASWDRALAGACAIDVVSSFDVSDLPVKIAAQVPRGDQDGEFDADAWMEPKEQRKNDDFIVYGVGAASMAMEDSGWAPKSEEDRARTGVMIGSGIGGLPGIYEASVTLLERGPRRVSPFFIPSTLINLVTGQVSIRFGLTGPNHAVATACATGAHAIGDAARMIQMDDADVMVAAARKPRSAESVSPVFQRRGRWPASSMTTRKRHLGPGM